MPTKKVPPPVPEKKWKRSSLASTSTADSKRSSVASSEDFEQKRYSLDAEELTSSAEDLIDPIRNSRVPSGSRHRRSIADSEDFQVHKPVNVNTPPQTK